MTTTATNPAECVIAWTSFCSPLGDVNQEAVLSAGDPIVKTYPQYFVPFGTPTNQWPHVFDQVIAQNEQQARELEQEKRERFEADARKNPILSKVTLMRAMTDFFETVDGRAALVRKGHEVSDDHWLVAAHPDKFTAVKR